MSILPRIIPATAAAFGFALFLISPCKAEIDAEIADEAALKAIAKMTFEEKVGPFLEKYCVRCHDSRPKGGINLKSALKSPGSASSFQHWKKAVTNVKVHDMPPNDVAEIPADDVRHQFIEWIGNLKYLAPRDPGPFVIRRLTKVEFGNTLRDLYGVDPSITDSLPYEVVGEGYLNSFSPLQSELFLDIANEVINQIVAPEGKPPTAVQKRLFGEAPTAGTDIPKEVRRIARSLAQAAYRRPPSTTELDVLVDIYNLAKNYKLNHPAALGLMLKAALVSPQFLFITPTALQAQPNETIITEVITSFLFTHRRVEG